ncbi:MAG: glycosyltransferase family 4 protein [Erythrobacter sp.]
MDYIDVYVLEGANIVMLAMLSRYERTGASSRQRMLQYEQYLKSAGIVSSIEPFFDTFYLEALYAGRPTRTSAVAAYYRRALQLRRAMSADLLWIEKEALPWAPWAIEKAFLPGSIPVAVDLDDAVFHQYDLHRHSGIRLMLGKKLDELMKSASLVTAGNQYLADRAERAGATRVEIVPTVVDLSAYSMRSDPQTDAAVKIGWIGTPSTWNAYVLPMLRLLTGVAKSAGARISVVGGGGNVPVDPIIDNLPWAEATEVEQIQLMDIGIMPLTDTPWARGKCGYKLIQYMACGLPVVASPVGVNADIVDHGVNGFLASNDEEWRSALNTLLADPDLRRRMGAAGRKKVEEQYSLQVWGPRVAKMLRSVIETKGPN